MYNFLTRSRFLRFCLSIVIFRLFINLWVQARAVDLSLAPAPYGRFAIATITFPAGFAEPSGVPGGGIRELNLNPSRLAREAQAGNPSQVQKLSPELQEPDEFCFDRAQPAKTSKRMRPEQQDMPQSKAAERECLPGKQGPNESEATEKLQRAFEEARKRQSKPNLTTINIARGGEVLREQRNIPIR
jgi:hypothetical protein